MSPSPDPRRRASAEALALAGVLALALALRAVPAARWSLWLDELHTLHHATRASLLDLLRSVRLDNHPPLAFLASRASRAAFGGSELALRLSSVLAGVAGVALAARLAGRLAPERTRSAARVRIAGPLLVAAAGLHVAASAEARMYAWLALGVLLALEGALALSAAADGTGARAGRAALFAGLVIALHAHYHALHALLVLGPAAAAALPRGRRRALVAPAAAAAAAALPWYAWAFPAQLAHALPPGGAGASARRLGEGFAHLLFHNASLFGPARAAFVLAAALALALALLGCARALRAGAERRAAGLLLGAAAFALPAWAAVVAAVVPRAGFHWMYLAASAPPFALLVALEAGAEGRLARARRAATWSVVALALALSARVALGPPREDHRGAAEHVLAQARPGDVVLAADWQPAIFPHGIGWRYYAARAEHPPRTLAVGPDFAIEDPAALEDAPRAFLIGRSLHPDVPALVELRARFPKERVVRFGEAIFVHVFER